MFVDETGTFALLALVAINLMCLWLIRQTSMCWNRSVSEGIAEELSGDG